MNSFTQRFEQANFFGSLFTNGSHAQDNPQGDQNSQWLNSTRELKRQGESQQEQKCFNPVIGRDSLHTRNEKKRGVSYYDALQKEYENLLRESEFLQGRLRWEEENSKDEIQHELQRIEEIYIDEANTLKRKLIEIKNFYENATQNAREREDLISEIAILAHQFEEKAKDVESKVVHQSRKLNEDANEMKRIALMKIKELDKKEEDLEESRRLHELEIATKEETARAKRNNLKTIEEDLGNEMKKKEMIYESNEKQMLENEETIQHLQDLIVKKKATVVELKRRKSLKGRLFSIFCSCVRR